MTQYRIEESRPDWYKGLGPIYQIHDESGPIRRLKWDYQPTAIAVCERLNNGLQLLAELSFKLNGEQMSVAIPAFFAENDEVLYAHVVESLPPGDQQAMTLEAKRLALTKNGYTETIVYWEPIKEL